VAPGTDADAEPGKVFGDGHHSLQPRFAKPLKKNTTITPNGPKTNPKIKLSPKFSRLSFLAMGYFSSKYANDIPAVRTAQISQPTMMSARIIVHPPQKIPCSDWGTCPEKSPSAVL